MEIKMEEFEKSLSDELEHARFVLFLANKFRKENEGTRELYRRLHAEFKESESEKNR
jgi:hypothetical protein